MSEKLRDPRYKDRFRPDLETNLKLAAVVAQLTEILRQKPDAKLSVMDMDATPCFGLIDKISYDPDRNAAIIETVWNY